MDNFHGLSVFAPPRYPELSTENSCLQLQLGDARGARFAQPDRSQRAPELLIREFPGGGHLSTGGEAVNCVEIASRS
ncbi:MAG: hypothetical protein WCE49_15340, partial [Terrimicrobiaceae bacterium]